MGMCDSQPTKGRQDRRKSSRTTIPVPPLAKEVGMKDHDTNLPTSMNVAGHSKIQSQSAAEENRPIIRVIEPQTKDATEI